MEAQEIKCKKCGNRFRITPIELRFMASQGIKPGETCRPCSVNGRSTVKPAVASSK